MELPLYRKGDQVIFDANSTPIFCIGEVEGIQSSGEAWEYYISYVLNGSKKLTYFAENKIRGVLFTSLEKSECSERGTIEASIDLES